MSPIVWDSQSGSLGLSSMSISQLAFRPSFGRAIELLSNSLCFSRFIRSYKIFKFVELDPNEALP